ncbi:MAG TPA: glutamate--tRNA ligase family protein, partial [Deferrisomatales bacterium]|nr:glutamate--tRNA ligase family protein [Deferrisomatales bacterium]
LTLDHNKAKISKRKHGEIVAIHFYREHGFIPWALNNFLVLLGWSPGNDQEIFSRDELIQAFSLERINRSNAVFNYRKDDPKFFTDPKAININGHYLRTLPVAEVAALAKPFLVDAGLWDAAFDGERRAWYLDTIESTRERFHTLTDFADLARAYFSDEFPIDPKALQKNLLQYPELEQLLPALADRLAALEPFTAEATEAAAREFAEEHGVKVGIPINAARAVITGQVKGPSMFEVFVHLGRETVVRRLRSAPQRFA